MSRTETQVKRNKVDEEKRKEELELWSRVPVEKENTAEMVVQISVSPSKTSDKRVFGKDKVQTVAKKPPTGYVALSRSLQITDSYLL